MWELCTRNTKLHWTKMVGGILCYMETEISTVYNLQNEFTECIGISNLSELYTTQFKGLIVAHYLRN